MTRHVLQGRMGQADRVRAGIEPAEVLTAVDMLDFAGKPGFGVGRAVDALKRVRAQPSAVGIELMRLAALVHAADTRLNRLQTSQDGWTREIRIVVPVADPDAWEGTRELLGRMLRFLTGDLWQVGFRPSGEVTLGNLLDGLTMPHRPFERVSLFSGGLDSLIGAIDLLEGGDRPPLFVSHGGEGAVSGPQRKLFTALGKAYPRVAPLARVRLGMTFPSGLVDGVRGEDSTRGRSFLFIALAAFAGSGSGGPFEIRVPENGLISLNVPLDPTRLGSNSTRTTHPFYIHRWNELLKAVGIPATVVNAYWNRTKGEMVAECANAAVLEKLAPMSVSCAHPSVRRWTKGREAHCGYCLPCIIRRASLAKAPWPKKDETGYALQDLSSERLDTKTAKGKQFRGFEYALERLRREPDLARSWVYRTGPLKEDEAMVPDLVSVYERGMAEVAGIVGQAETFSSDRVRD